MNRIAVFADVHGNMPALEAVLEDLRTQEVDEVLVGGDLVGRGPEGDRVVRTVAATGWATIRGNHEDYLLTFRRGEVPGEWLESDHWAASRWMARELSEGAAAYISTLPLSLVSRLEPGLRLVHGSPRSTSEGLGPWSSDADLARHLGDAGEPLLVCAHTHRPMLRRVEGGVVVNVGSVGLPFNRDRRAQYAVFWREGGDWQVEFRRVAYPLERILATYESSGFLAAGGVTARLLRHELEEAAPFLVPFLQWAEASGVEPAEPRLEEFLDLYDPDAPLRDFYARLGRVPARREGRGP